MKKSMLRTMATAIVIATCIGASGCAVYDDGYYYAEAAPPRPAYVYPRAYYFGPAYRDEGHWRHERRWRRDDD